MYKPTITSSVKVSQFPIINNNDLKLASSGLVYFILIVAYNMLESLVDP